MNRLFSIARDLPDLSAYKEAFLAEWSKRALPEIDAATLEKILALKDGGKLDFQAGKKHFAAVARAGGLGIYSKSNSLLMAALAIAAVLLLLAASVALLGFYPGKPAVYLYPEQDMQVSVKLRLNGEITKDIPPYGEGWNVFATKEGRIDGKYDYLFYEARINSLEVPDKGWMVKYEDLEGWFDIHLARMGLNSHETPEFKEYWLSRLPKANYYEIKMLDKDFLERDMALDVTPAPDTVIRVMLCFRPINVPEAIEEPVLATPERKGFTVVEWGGLTYNRLGWILYS